MHPAHPQVKTSFADKLNFLFDTVKPKNDDDRKHRRKSQHSNDEVAKAVAAYTGEPCSHNYIGKLRSGASAEPKMAVVEAIADFFEMPPAYFFDDARSQAMMEQMELATILADSDARALVLRELQELDPADVPVITETMRALRRVRQSKKEDPQ
ncbi:helix-turn-helix domain-containing protein [Amycolatopsis sp. RTGN1]|uniref:helix-turn-helix domain-containing protein n=1 Tax=Amycolatopsis ponsaeliensis TaxID=2992142 RepID=UPI00254E6E07|nr:hypothetical protein [Amycolatopsis sp. RTGN1]